MKNIILPIDTKSLYMNIYNDNSRGHTCTVATPIKQGNSINMELINIYSLPYQIDINKFPNIAEILSKSSKSLVRISNVFIFDKIKVNNEVVVTDSKFCMFIKEEVDPLKSQFGRLKLHYPFNLKIDELGVNNRRIMLEISNMLNNYAFIVKQFEFNEENNFLNFNSQIIGYNGIPYSKVFINNKGVGNKFSEISMAETDCYDREIVYLRKKYGDIVSPDNFLSYYSKMKDYGFELIKNKLESEGCTDIERVSNLYPYSLYDIQFYKFNHLYYGIIKLTLGNKEYFDLTSEKYKFINTFSNSSIFLITSLFDKNNIKEINSVNLETMKLSMNSIRFIGEN